MSNKKNNFLVQGSILAMAGILTRIIGIIYRIPLTNILGNGASAYSIAYDIYSLFLLISSLSLPLAVSKIVAARMAKGEVRNAKKALKGSVIISGALGIAVSILVFVFADKLAALWGFPSAGMALKVLAPTLFVMCILGVLRGFFQGLGTMIPTAMSQIFEQIVNAIVSVAAAYVLYDMGSSVGKAVEYSAAGGTLGTALGALTALLFMIFVFLVYRHNFNRMVRRDRYSYDETYKELSKVLVITIFPVLLSTTIYNIGSIIDSAMYGNIMGRVFGFSQEEYEGYWSIYSTQYRLLTTAPIAIASALSSAVVPSLIRSITNGDIRVLKGKIESSIRLTMIISIPCGIGLTVLAEPVISLLFEDNGLQGDAVMLMRLSVFVVCAYSFSTITNSILQGIDKMKLPVIHSAISLGAHIFILSGLLLMKMDVYAVAVADIIFALMVCFMNIAAIRKHIGYRQEVIKTFIMPLLSALIMGGMSWLIYKGLYMLAGSVFVPLIISILAAIVIYGVLLMVFKVVNESEIRMFPGGSRLVPILKRTKLLS